MGEILPPLTKLVLNNFVVQKRPVARQAKTHVINGLVHNTRRLREKIEKIQDDEKQRARLEAKADKLVKEVLFLKTVPPDEMMKFALLNKKTFAAVGSNPASKIEERVLCRAAEHKAVKESIVSLKEKHADWTEDLPHLIKGLGIRHREKKLQKLKRQGKLETYLEKEQRNLKLLQELTGIDLKAGDETPSTADDEREKKKKSSGSSSSRSRKRKRERDLDEKTLNVLKKKGKMDQVSKEESNDDDDDSDGESNMMEKLQGKTDDDDDDDGSDNSGDESDGENDERRRTTQTQNVEGGESDDDDDDDDDDDMMENGSAEDNSDNESDEGDIKDSPLKSSIVFPGKTKSTTKTNGQKTKTNHKIETEGHNPSKKIKEGKKRNGKK